MTLRMNAYSKIGHKILVLLSGLKRTKETEVEIESDSGKKVKMKSTYEQHDYKIPKNYQDVRWSKSLIKQTVLYTSLCDSKGEIHFVYEKDIADKIGVSVRTVKHNNKILSDAGIVTWKRLFSDAVMIAFQEYAVNILGLDETENKMKATGYTRLSNEQITQLLQIEDVNVIRFALRNFSLMEKEFHLKKKEEAYVYLTDIRTYLPKYVGYKAAIKGICSKVQHLFSMELISEPKGMELFLKGKRITKELALKTKDAFVYVFKKTENTLAQEVHQQDIAEIRLMNRDLDTFRFVHTPYKRQCVILDEKDEIEPLITTFGKEVVATLHTFIHSLFAKVAKNITLTTEEHNLLSDFVDEPSFTFRKMADDMVRA